MSLKLLPKLLLASIFSLITKTQNNSQNSLSKSLPIMCTLVGKLSNRYNYFLRLPEFPDLFSKFKFSNNNFQHFFVIAV